MKKLVMLFSIIAPLLFPGLVFALEEGPYLPLNGGGTMVDAPYIGLGGINGRIASISVPCYAMCNINRGDAVVLATSLTTTAMAVTKTTSAASTSFIGIAKDPIAYGKVGQVVTYGVAIANVALSVSLGDKLVTSGTAGFLTGTAILAESLYTPLSTTAIAGRAAQYKVYATDFSGVTTQARVFIGAK
jgi:hypothetical protein